MSYNPEQSEGGITVGNGAFLFQEAARTPMNQALAHVTVARPEVSELSIAAAGDALRSGWLGYGPRCQELEQTFCSRRGGWAVATQSCTAALWAVAMVAKSGSQPEIVIPANTYIACAAAFQLAGWKVRLCDVDPVTGLLDLDDAHRHVSSNTCALLIVDTYGQRFPEQEAKQFCSERGLWLVRDAAHRLDLDDRTPPLSDFVCYSFGPTKEAASPDGGLVWSSESKLEEQVRALTYWGISHDTWQRSASRVHAEVTVSAGLGLKLRMTDVTASIVLTQLLDWPRQRQRRRAIIQCYRQALDGSSAAVLERGGDDSCLMAPLLVDPSMRTNIRSSLAALGIATSDHYPSLAALLPGPHADCPSADAFCSSVIAMPMHGGVTDADIIRAASAFAGAG